VFARIPGDSSASSADQPTHTNSKLGPLTFPPFSLPALRRKLAFAVVPGRYLCSFNENGSTCVYEVPTRQSKIKMKSEIERLRQQQQQSQRILDALASNNHSAEILNQLQNGERLEDISRTLEISDRPRILLSHTTMVRKAR
jgi:hypothetical protein